MLIVSWSEKKSYDCAHFATKHKINAHYEQFEHILESTHTMKVVSIWARESSLDAVKIFAIIIHYHIIIHIHLLFLH